jgi:hypothetical protein
VLLVKTNPTTAENIIKLLEVVLKKLENAEIEDKLVIITKKRIRIIS